MLPDADTFYRLLAEQIKFERIKKKVSQQDLADHLDLSRTSIINIETGRHRPSLYQVLQIAAYLGIDYFLLIPYQVKKPEASIEEPAIELRDALSDQGTIEELDPTSQTAITKFWSDLK